MDAIHTAIHDRAIGALIGLAVGDALGVPLEFSQRDTRPVVSEMIGGGPFSLAPGVWTDDTSMALCLADSILARNGLDPSDLMQRFVRWWTAGHNSPTGTCFDIGTTTRAALAMFRETGNPLAGVPDPESAGNGSIMRLAPVAIFSWRDCDRAAELGRLQSRCTHGASEAVDACAFMARFMAELIQGKPFSSRIWSGEPAVADVARWSWSTKDRAQIESSGYVIHTLEAAFWAVGTSANFEAALIKAVNLADDSDSIGAVTGQLAGARWGASAIPERWLSKLAWRERIHESAALILQVLKA